MEVNAQRLSEPGVSEASNWSFSHDVRVGSERFCVDGCGYL